MEKKGTFIKISILSICLVVGLVFLMIGVVASFRYLNYEDKVEITGIISRIEPSFNGSNKASHSVWVKYLIDQHIYETELNGYSSDFYEGKEINIYYDKNNPEKIGMKSLDVLILICPFCGVIFFLIGSIGFFIIMNHKRIEKKLLKTGRKVTVQYLKTIINESYSINGIHPFIIICEWENPEDGKKYLLKSKNIWENPEFKIEQNHLKYFFAYINMNNIKQYFIDISSLEEM